MNYEDVRTAYNQAQDTISKSDIAVRQAASLIAGRLRSAECWVDDLRKLKKELQSFNTRTGKWKE